MNVPVTCFQLIQQSGMLLSPVGGVQEQQPPKPFERGFHRLVRFSPFFFAHLVPQGRGDCPYKSNLVELIGIEPTTS